MAWNTLSRKLTWFNRPQQIPSTPEAMELHQLESRRIIRKYNDRNLFEEGNVRQFLANTGRGGTGVVAAGTGNDALTRIRPGHFVTVLRPAPDGVTNEMLGQQFTQFTSLEHNDGYITRIHDNATFDAAIVDVTVPANQTAVNNALTAVTAAPGEASDVYTPVYVAQEPQEFAGGRTIMHEYYPGERLIFIIPRRGVWLQVRVHNAYATELKEGDFVQVTKTGTVIKADAMTDRNNIVGIVRQGIAGEEFTMMKQNALSPTTPKYDARLVTIEIV